MFAATHSLARSTQLKLRIITLVMYLVINSHLFESTRYSYGYEYH